MILFGTKRERHFPDAWIQRGRLGGRDRSHIVDHVETRTFPTQAGEEPIAFVQKHTVHGAEIGALSRKERWSLPPVALRESHISAVVHTDYAQPGTSPRLSIFDERLDAENPGLLLFALTVEDLRRGVSNLRNRVIEPIFHALGLAEKWGCGFLRIATACREAGLGAPMLDENGLAILACLANSEGWLTSEVSAGIGLAPRATRICLARRCGRRLVPEASTRPQDPRRRYSQLEGGAE